MRWWEKKVGGKVKMAAENKRTSQFIRHKNYLNLSKRLMHRTEKRSFPLKELRNYKRKLICVCHKDRQKKPQHFKTTVFHNKFTLCHIKANT